MASEMYYFFTNQFKDLACISNLDKFEASCFLLVISALICNIRYKKWRLVYKLREKMNNKIRSSIFLAIHAYSA